MRVDTQCSVAISNFIEEECSTTQPPATMATAVTLATASDPLQSDNTAAIIGGVVAVILIMAIGIIAIVALVLRARRGRMSIKTPEE